MEIDNYWTLECQIAFDKLKAQVANIVELRHFDIHRDMRTVCDTSHKGIGDVREKLGSASRRWLSFVSCYPDGGEKNYPTDELEMLAVVWGQNLMKKLRNIKKILVVTDHQALVSLLNGINKKNKTTLSRLTRWLDRLIYFDFPWTH